MAMTRREYANIFDVQFAIPDGDREIDRDFVLFIDSCRRVFADIDNLKKDDDWEE